MYPAMWFIELKRGRRANDRRLPSIDRELPISAIFAVDVPSSPPSRQFCSVKLRGRASAEPADGPLRGPSRAVADGERTPPVASLGRPAVSVKRLPRYRVGMRLWARSGSCVERVQEALARRRQERRQSKLVPLAFFAKPIGGYRFPRGARNGQRRRSNAFRLITATRALSATRLPAGTRSAVGSGPTNRYRGSQLGRFTRATVCRAHYRSIIASSAAITVSRCSPP